MTWRSIARAIRLVTTRKAVTITRPLSRPHRLNCVRPGSRLTRLRAASSASSQPSSATPAITHKTNVMRFFGVYLLGRMLDPGTRAEHPAEQVNAEAQQHQRAHDLERAVDDC